MIYKGASSNKMSASQAQDRPAKKNGQIIYGMRPVIEALESGVQIDKVMLQTGLSGVLFSDLKRKLQEANVPFQFVPVEKLNHITSNNHQGVVATISPIKYQSFETVVDRLQEEQKTPLIVMLDHVTDVRNMGAIARTVECVGADAIVVPAHGSAQVNEDAIKTSSGALLRIPVCREENLKTVIFLAKQLGFQVCAATEKASELYVNVDFKLPTLLIMGAEDTGISNELLKLASVRAKLPIFGEVQSLNVSVAAGVFLYEAYRQRMA